MKKKATAKELTPKKYREILRGVQLHRFLMAECAAKLKQEELVQARSISIDLSDKPKVRQKMSDGFVVEHIYSLIAKPTGTRAHALKITCTFVLMYSSTDEVPDEFLEIFIKRNVRTNSWPYFRELVQNMTQRMDVPPLTLPLLKQ